jgi:hypothetical protein
MPEDTCKAANQPETADCTVMDTPGGFEYIKLDSGYSCYYNGNRNWRDIHAFGTCQASIGWDTTQGKPNVSF